MATSQPASRMSVTKSMQRVEVLLVDDLRDRFRAIRACVPSTTPMRIFTVTGSLHARLHRRDAIRDALRLVHQARAERAARHAIARATAVEIDLVVAGVFAGARRAGEIVRLAAAELQGDRMLFGIEASSRSRSPRRIAAAVIISV